jgi:UDP-N-acetylglucosamine acyltransferase
MSIDKTAIIHSSAIIKDGAKIGANVKIGAYCIVDEQVVIDDNCVLYNHIGIYNKTHIGKNNKIYSHTVLGSIPQDLKYSGENSELIIGDGNSIREFCLINIGTQDGGNKTIIGNNNLIMSHSHIAHDCIIKDDCILSSNTIIAGHVEIFNGVVIGGATAIHQFVHIGEYSMLAGGSTLAQDLPPFCLAQGNRAIIRSLNIVGLRRNFPDEIDELKKVLKFILKDKVNMRKNIEDFLKKTDNKHIKSLCLFILNAKRGIPN